MAQYFFLCASLPMLSWGEPMKISLAEFMSACKGQLSKGDYASLEEVALTPAKQYDANDSLLSQYWNWECCLRNALMPARAGKREFSSYLREEKDCFAEIASIVSSVSSNSDIMGVEKQLDQARWQAIETMLGCEAFTINAIIAYKLKLLLLEKYENRTVPRGEANMDKILANLQGTATSVEN